MADANRTNKTKRTAANDPGVGSGGNASDGAGTVPVLQGPSDLDTRIEELARQIANDQHISYARATERAARKLAKLDKRTSGTAASTGDPDTTDTAPSSAGTVDASQSTLDFSTVEAQPRQPRNQKPRVSKAQLEAEAAAKLAAATAASNAKTQAAMLILLLESLAVNAEGDEARLNTIEHVLIDTSLPEMIASVDESKVAAVAKYANPAMLLLGFSLYGLRLRVLHQQRTRSDDNNNPPPPPSYSPPDVPLNGHSQNETIRDAGSIHQQVEEILANRTLR